MEGGGFLAVSPRSRLRHLSCKYSATDATTHTYKELGDPPGPQNTPLTRTRSPTPLRDLSTSERAISDLIQT